MELVRGPKISLGVLPAAEAAPSGGEDGGYFARGFLEDLITDLSRFSNLGVISSHSTFSGELLGLGDREAADRLGADFLLRTSFRDRGSGFRLNAQLVAPGDGGNDILWAERYDVPREQLFDVQEQVAAQVTSALSKHIDSAVLEAARKKPAVDLEAYDCWLRGYHKLREGSTESDTEAREDFRRALEIDPHYARAYVGLSLSHFNDWSCQAWDLAEASECFSYDYAREAIKLDDTDHITHYVLGRVLLFRRDFDRAELHIDRSLALNQNDADTLVQIALCKMLLGSPEEAEQLIARATELNPLHDAWYFAYAAFVQYALKNYDEQLKLAMRCPLRGIWLDFSGNVASGYAYLGDLTKAQEYLAVFREDYRDKISKGSDPLPGEEIAWLKLINPFRHPADEDHFVEGFRLAGLDVSTPAAGGVLAPPTPEAPGGPTAAAAATSANRFAGSGGTRQVAYAGKAATLPEVKGFADIETLLARSGEEVHCTELMGNVTTLESGHEVLDARARAAYRERICELQADLEEAESRNDEGQAARARAELDPLLDHLAQASGIGGRSRKLKNPAERARSAVTWRIRSAIKKLTPAHPELAKHLENSVRTGVFCSYSPETAVAWTTGDGAAAAAEAEAV